ncbi:MAG: DUF1599 domain-containing protein [Micrococcales bacterium]|nr:DUF1599 domain-containing protein [Micrococcales bacterium]
MADYPIRIRTGIEDRVISEARRSAKDNLSNPSLAREVHLEVHLSNTVNELSDLLLSKHKDYGPKNISQAPGGAINGLRVRMHDKLARINNLIDSGANPEHESLEDSFKDMANYAIIGLLVLRKQWDND